MASDLVSWEDILLVMSVSRLSAWANSCLCTVEISRARPPELAPDIGAPPVGSKKRRARADFGRSRGGLRYAASPTAGPCNSAPMSRPPGRTPWPSRGG